MKQMQLTEVKFAGLNESSMPWVIVSIRNDDAKLTGSFLLDSCSTDNIISSRVVKDLNLNYSYGKRAIVGINKGVYNAQLCQIAFELGGRVFTESFAVECSNLLQGGVLGVLGNNFLQRNNLSIDFSSKTLHISNVSPSNLRIDDCSYFFPMMIGLKAYGVPVVQMRGRQGKDFVVMVDSGSEKNVITFNASRQASLRYQGMKSYGTIDTMVGTVPIWDARIVFQLGSLTSEPNPVRFQSHSATFQVTPAEALLAIEQDSRVPAEFGIENIDVLVGSDFISQQGWILDFGAKIIYARK